MNEITRCIHCPKHEVRRDPDPSDWFCDDDIKVVCTTARRNVTEHCRPYNIEEETKIPLWCPHFVLKPGDKVTYESHGKLEHGIVKSISDQTHMFVVYHCDGKWDEYQNYTAARTCTFDLKPGWI